jgi:hypothetical protein
MDLKEKETKLYNDKSFLTEKRRKLDQELNSLQIKEKDLMMEQERLREKIRKEEEELEFENQMFNDQD